MDVVHAGAITLHTLAMIVVLGYYAVLGRVVVPALRRAPDTLEAGRLLASIEARALPIIAVAVVAFIVTGVWLMLTDEQYLGLGTAPGTWGALILAKHAIVLGLVALGVLVDVLVRDVGRTDMPETADGRLRRVGLASDGVSALGVVVVALTAMAQLSS